MADLGPGPWLFLMPLSFSWESKVVTIEGIREAVDGIVAVTSDFIGQ